MESKDRKNVLLRIHDLLPATSCRRCGEKSCRDFAEKLITGERKIHECPYVSEETQEEIILILAEYFK